MNDQQPGEEQAADALRSAHQVRSAIEMLSGAVTEFVAAQDREHERRLAHQVWMDAWLARFEAAVDADPPHARILAAERDWSPDPESPKPAPLTTLEGDRREIADALTKAGRQRRRVALMGHLAGCQWVLHDGAQPCNCDASLAAMGLHHLQCAAWSGGACNCAALRT
jgi:hypothetical protein